MPIRTYVYVDGFNLYYGCLKGTSYKWLDLQKLCEFLLPDSEIAQIHYFTAIVSGTGDDPDKHLRQRAYLRALSTLPNMHIVLGHFLTERIRLPLADGSGDAEVLRSKEKGTDVNLATYLMWDAYQNHFDLAVLISGDLDFVSPVRVIRQSFKKQVGILDPQRRSGPNSKLHQSANWFKPIREGVLRLSQFPDKLNDDKGEFWKPGDWFEKR